MPLFVLDHDCMDRSITCAYEVRAVLLWCPLHGCDGLFLLAGSRGWRARDVGDRHWHISATWLGTRGKVKPWDHATRWRHLCGPTVGGGGKKWSGRARRMVQKPHLGQ